MKESEHYIPIPFLNRLKEFFYIEMDQQTSACLYGSAATDNWVAARSDLDLFVFIPEEKIELFGEKIKKWQSNSAHPHLDGFVLYSSGNGTMVREIHKFEKAIRLGNFIPLIDLWNVKNRSIHLFGQDVKAFVREISQDDLKDWAFKDIKNHWIPLLNDMTSRENGSPEAKIPLSVLILMASGVARMLMLTTGNICSSKRDALRWLAYEYIEIQDSINLLMEDFDKPDNATKAFTATQALMLGKFYLNLLREVKR